jgi:hypothetical protein
MDLGDIGWGNVDWIQMAQDRDRWRAFVNTVMNLRVLTPRSWLVIFHSFTLSNSILKLISYLLAVVFWNMPCSFIM